MVAQPNEKIIAFSRPAAKYRSHGRATGSISVSPTSLQVLARHLPSNSLPLWSILCQTARVGLGFPLHLANFLGNDGHSAAPSSAICAPEASAPCTNPHRIEPTASRTCGFVRSLFCGHMAHRIIAAPLPFPLGKALLRHVNSRLIVAAFTPTAERLLLYSTMSLGVIWAKVRSPKN